MDWIVTDNISKEVWRRLLEYANAEIALDRIIQLHGEPTSKTIGNYKKQAAQARACVLQAHEYYAAAKASSLYTSPNHIYYGNICLATLIMLICGDGSMALDVLRRDGKNNHHGLDFSLGCDAKAAKIGFGLLENSYCELLKYGQFANWYNCLPSMAEVSAVIRKSNGGVGQLARRTVGSSRIAPYSALVGKKFSLLDLIKLFPDLALDMRRLGLVSIFCRADHYVEINQKNNRETHTFLLHGLDEENRDSILSRFAVEPRGGDCFEVIENPPGAIVNFKMDKDALLRFSWPDSRETLSHDTIFYGVGLDRHEIVDLYLCSYQLSMLSRYFPDIWVAGIESQGKAAKIVELLIDVQEKKFPVLALGFISGIETVISTHRPPWKKPLGP